ncbi:ATP-dependent DNA helicase pif1 [Elysia marginata]|uniref:ATP-dependent DNA helicase pif1 n=1 Tax=Elysia marginata TaxID=1093978 RepID=A0AAV4G7S8_9GAST|nr:ATP-dependent DNA helicase pif1 [Elysia marginata]
MLLRNLDPVNGHCNGTRYVIDNLHDHIIDETIACGPHAGKRIFIPRIPIIPSDNIFPFHMKRKQFPVRPAFAITASKAQGQRLEQIGIYLKNHFFTHGELYIAISRVGSKRRLKILTGKR